MCSTTQHNKYKHYTTGQLQAQCKGMTESMMQWDDHKHDAMGVVDAVHNIKFSKFQGKSPTSKTCDKTIT
jgi:hypothetical protein